MEKCFLPTCDENKIHTTSVRLLGETHDFSKKIILYGFF